MRFLFIYLGISLCFTKSLSAEQIKILYLSDEHIFTLEKNGSQQNFFSDLFLIAAQKIDREIEIKRMPWKRAQKIIQQTTGGAIAPLTRTKEREPHYHWLHPLFPLRISYFTIKQTSPAISSLQEARQKRIGVKRGTFSEQIGARHQIPLAQLNSISSSEQILKLLDHGRIDAWLVWDLVAYRLNGALQSPLDLERGFGELLGTMYFATSLDVSEDERKLWSGAFAQTIEEGHLERLFINYFGVSYSHAKSKKGPL